MAYYTAKKRESDQRWDYTCTDGSGVYPIGYCAGWQDYDEERKKKIAERAGMDVLERLLQDQEKLRPTKDKYHENGHETAAEAHACFAQFELDHHFATRDDSEVQKKCRVCGEWTTKRATILGPHSGYDEWALCESHATREHLGKVRQDERDKRAGEAKECGLASG